MASDFKSAFAQYVSVPVFEIFLVVCVWSKAELATISCAYASAKTMLYRVGLAELDHASVTGASGDVGSAVIQLERRCGVMDTALTSRSKSDEVRALSANSVVMRCLSSLFPLLPHYSLNLSVGNAKSRAV